MQRFLFAQNSNQLVSIEEAAATAKVSSATIRNWIKTGNLSLEQKGHIDSRALTELLKTRPGTKKLTSRANKSQKDFHDHEQLANAIFIKLNRQDIDPTKLGDDYQKSLSESFRNKEGIYYTPSHVVNNLFDADNSDLSELTFLDPCCGSGNFIVRALELGFRVENIYGFDVDPVAVEITRRRIFQLTGIESKNFKKIDFLKDSASEDFKLFDYIYTNPPWGKKLDIPERIRFAKAFNVRGSVDTCSLFMFASLRRLKPGGKLGLLLPDAFFNIAVFEAARDRILSLRVTAFIDYDRPFKGLLTKAFAVILRNEAPVITNASVECRTKNEVFIKQLSTFSANPKSIINFQSRPEHDKVIRHILNRPHVRLSEQDKWGLGIVTGNNIKFVESIESETAVPVFRGSDILKVGLANPTCYISSDFSQYQQVAPLDLYQAPVKLIYKFISSTLCFYCDRKQRFILNSANMVIPNDNFPITPEQLASLLNSEIINWLFLTLFRTHKVLRADLESIPIHAEFFTGHSFFNEDQYLNFLQIEKDGYGAYRIKNEDN